MPKPTNEARIKKLEENMEEMLSLLKKQDPKEPLVDEPAEQEQTEFQVPTEYRESVDKVLNDSFGVNIVPMTDAPSFQFNVVVPEKYSSLTKEQMKMYGADVRSKVITYAEGKNGVEEWAQKVWSSFKPDMQSMITADRQKT